MVVDTGLMEDPQEPTHAHIGEYAYNRTEYDDMRADSSSVLLLAIGILGIVALNCGFRLYRGFCMRIREERGNRRYIRTSETLVSRIIDVSEPSDMEVMGMCPICLEPLAETNPEDPSEDLREDLREELTEEPHTAIKLKCGHVFHRGCLQEWLQKNMTCPICRTPV